MIPYDFEYYKPATVNEAVSVFQQLDSQGKRALYYSGGTEIITLGRINQLRTDAVIDIKGIPECTMLEVKDDKLVLGAGVSLTRIAETNLFPLLTESAGRVADHTSRGKITLGGNICGNFIYREAVLPLLVSDSSVVIAGIKGLRTVPILEAFHGRLQLKEGEFFVQVTTEERYLSLPHRGIKKTRLDRIGYPLVSIAILENDERIQLAISGLCAFPFRSLEIENELNSDRPYEIRIANTLPRIPDVILDDVEGSSEYRKFMLKNTLLDILTHFKG